MGTALFPRLWSGLLPSTSAGTVGSNSLHSKLPLCQQWQNIFLVMAAERTLAKQWQEIITATAELIAVTSSLEQSQTYDTRHKLGSFNTPVNGINTLLCGLAWGLWYGDRPLPIREDTEQPVISSLEITSNQVEENHPSIESPIKADYAYAHEVLTYDGSSLGIVNFIRLALSHNPYGEPRQWLEDCRNFWDNNSSDMTAKADNLAHDSSTTPFQELDSISDLLTNVRPIADITEYLHSPWSVALYLILSNPWQPKLSLQRVNLLENLSPIAPFRAEVSLLVQIWLAAGGIYEHGFSNISPDVATSARATADQWFTFWSGAMTDITFTPTTLIGNYRESAKSL